MPNHKTQPNVPNYKSQTNGAGKSNTSSHRVNETPRQKIQISSDRKKKGSDDPISNHNRFDALSEEEMDDDGDFVPIGPPPSAAKGGRITRLHPPT